MNTTAQPTRLLPRQTRMIHASAGARLHVVSGRFWLTQPNAAQDLFLGPGAVVDLAQDWVVIGADAGPRPAEDGPPCYSEYLITPLAGSRRPRLGLLSLIVLAGSRGWRTAWRRVFRSSGGGRPAGSPLARPGLRLGRP